MNGEESINTDDFSEALSTTKKELKLESLKETRKKCRFENDLYVLKVRYYNKKFVVLTIVFDKDIAAQPKVTYGTHKFLVRKSD